MSDLLVDLANHFDYEDIGTSSGDDRDIAVGSMPDKPDNLISIVEYLGETSLVSNADNRSVNIKVRNTNYTNGKNKIWEIYNLYDPEDDKKLIMLNGTRWCIYTPRGTPYKLNTDESGRDIFNMNISIITNRD